MNKSRRGHVTVPGAMLKGKLRDKAMDCPQCGVPVYRYKGRYPTRCPNCDNSLRVLSRQHFKRRKVVDKRQIESLISEIVNDGVTPGDSAQKVLGIDPKAREAKIYNSAMGKIGLAGLWDKFVGHDIGEGSQDLKLLFGESATEEELKDLMAKLAEMQVPSGESFRDNITMQRVDSGLAKWVVIVRRPTTGQPQAQGKMGVQGPATGDLAVSR